MRTLFPILAILTLTALPAAAQSINEDLKLTAPDAAPDDIFGNSVATSGTTAIVGAYADDDAGPFSGSAYLFDTTTGNQLFKLTPSDAATGDQFGYTVAISGTTAIAGAHGDDDAGSFSGSAYIFDTTTGNQLFKLTASDAAPGDHFAYAVAISGTTAIVGAYADDDAGSQSGSAYLFDTTTGNQLFKLSATDAEPGDQFGWSVAISGNLAIVGAFVEGDAGSQSGAAYLFDTTTGNQLFKLTASDAAPTDWFGYSVAISGTTAIVGAFTDDDAGPDSGSAYLFDTTTGNQLFKLTASDAAPNDNFGYAVATSDTTAIVGAYLHDDSSSDSGAAYLFDTTTGLQISKLAPSDPGSGDRFGNAVAISPSTAIVGAYLDGEASSATGSAYLFNLNPCPTDLDNSGATDLADLNLILANFGTMTSMGDTNNDGIVDLADLNAVLATFGVPCA